MSFDAVVFAGGGCRCFWQAGFWAVAAPALELAPRTMAAVSAGAAFATAAATGTTDAVLRAFVRRTAANRSNFYAGKLLRGRRPFPHHGMYRDTILETMGASALARLRHGPEIRVLLTVPPARLRPASAALLGLGLYEGDRLIRRRVHPGWPRRAGFRPKVVVANACETPEELADVILQSSCLPPLMPVLRRDGEAVLDGAVIDSVPVELVADARSTLALLTRRYPMIPEREGVAYLQPSERVPIAMWDYASPRKIEAAFDLGRRDGEAFVRAAPR